MAVGVDGAILVKQNKCDVCGIRVSISGACRNPTKSKKEYKLDLAKSQLRHGLVNKEQCRAQSLENQRVATRVAAPVRTHWGCGIS